MLEEVKTFINDKCSRTSDEEWEYFRDLFGSFCAWWIQRHQQCFPYGKTMFGRCLATLKLHKQRGSATKIKGIKLTLPFTARPPRPPRMIQLLDYELIRLTASLPLLTSSLSTPGIN